jgi:hypothetical protein
MTPTDAYRIGIKLFLDPSIKVDLDAVIPVFHKWIQEQQLPGHLLIDVADYSHVHNGPGVVLVAHEANLSIDQADGRPGLYYQTKRPQENTTFGQRVAGARAAAQAAAELASRDLGYKFVTGEMLVRIADRLAAPNTAETFEAVRTDLTRALEAKSLEHRPSERPFEVIARF